jgi:Formin Homology 2 Domain
MPYALLNQPTISYWEQRPDLIVLDFDAVSHLFRAKLAAKKSIAAAGALASASLAVLDVKRATSVGVLMSKLHLPHSKLAKAVFELDDKARLLSTCMSIALQVSIDTWSTRRCGAPSQDLVRNVSTLRRRQFNLQVFVSRDEVDAILKCLPTSDELIKLQPYLSGKRSFSDLGPVEKFLLDLSRIPQIELRLSTFKHKFSIPEVLHETRALLENRKAAMEQVRLQKPVTTTIHDVKLASTRAHSSARQLRDTVGQA